MRKDRNGFFFRFCRIFRDNGITSASAEMAYYLLFAFFPILMVVFASLSLAGISGVDLFIKNSVFMPESVGELINSYLNHISSGSSSLSFLLTGVVLTLFSVARFTKVVKSNVRTIYHTKTSASVITEWIVSIIFSVLLLLVFYVTLFVMIMGEHIIKLISGYVAISAVAYKLLLILRYFITAFVVLFILTLFYLIIPNVRQELSDVVPGTVFTLASWIVVSLVFTFYINNIANYSVVYGSLGAFIILLLWFYMTSMLLLVGSIINSMVYNGKRNIKIGYRRVQNQ